MGGMSAANLPPQAKGEDWLAGARSDPCTEDAHRLIGARAGFSPIKVFAWLPPFPRPALLLPEPLGR